MHSIRARDSTRYGSDRLFMRGDDNQCGSGSKTLREERELKDEMKSITIIEVLMKDTRIDSSFFLAWDDAYGSWRAEIKRHHTRMQKC